VRIRLKLFSPDATIVLEEIYDFAPQFDIMLGSDHVFANAELTSFVAYKDINELTVTYIQVAHEGQMGKPGEWKWTKSA